MPCEALENVFLGRQSTQIQRTHGNPKIPRPKLNSSVCLIADCPRVFWTWASLMLRCCSLILCPNDTRACANSHMNYCSLLERPSVMTQGREKECHRMLALRLPPDFLEQPTGYNSGPNVDSKIATRPPGASSGHKCGHHETSGKCRHTSGLLLSYETYN